MKKLLLISILLLTYSYISYSATNKPKTEITGEQMVIKDSGKITVFTGNAKVVRGNSTVRADKMIYFKDTENVDAHGNIRFNIKNEDGSLIKATSKKATYNVKDYSGKLWDGDPTIEYILKDKKDKIYLYADNIELNKNFESAFAKDNVRIVSSSGTVKADNALLNKQNKTLLMKKDKNKPQVDVQQDDKQAHFTADEILMIYDTKTVQMNKNVEGKVIIENIDNLEIKK